LQRSQTVRAELASAALRLSAAFEVFLRVEGCHAAGARAGDGLAIDVFLHVASGEYARDAGGGRTALEAALGNDVAVLHFKLPVEYLGVGLVPDGDEDSF